ncbi:MAG: UDP-3-O-acyl-N-acetylglucosamine deacetylase [Pseudomonadota bacterium]
MRNFQQRTIHKSISCTGIGLHSGAMVRLSLHPAPEDAGIVFIRTDLPGRPSIRACLRNVAHTRLATTLGSDGVCVSTVEHLLSALMGLGVDNVRVELSGAEVPIMDGSSQPFVHLLKTAGIRSQDKFKKFIVVKKELTVEEDDKFVTVIPDKEFSIDYMIKFEHPLIQSQGLTFRFSDLGYERELSPARTFGFLHEVEHLKKTGFARGGSLSNAVVVDRFNVLNQDGLRFEDEFIRHKVLDFIGDVSLLGAPLIGRFTACKSGHSLNHALLNKLFKTPGAWESVEISSPEQCEQKQIYAPIWGQLHPVERGLAAA